MFVVGVDGCRGGWLAVKLSRDGTSEARIFPDMASLWSTYHRATLILVDIPIGLPDNAHGRPCDWLARKILGPRYRSVFPIPCRQAIYATTYDEAIKINERLTKKRIFLATWNIVPKIRQVDELLLKDRKACNMLREAHPEVLFWALAGRRPMAFKKTIDAGFKERLTVLQRIYPRTNSILSHGISCLRTLEFGRDDLMDALAAAVCGLMGWKKLQTLPPSPERDACGLPMEMVYFLPDH